MFSLRTIIPSIFFFRYNIHFFTMKYDDEDFYVSNLTTKYLPVKLCAKIINCSNKRRCYFHAVKIICAYKITSYIVFQKVNCFHLFLNEQKKVIHAIKFNS